MSCEEETMCIAGHSKPTLIIEKRIGATLLGL